MRESRTRRVAGVVAGREVLAGLALAAAFLAAVPAGAQQQAQTDPRWQAWLGCWQPVSGPTRVAGDTTTVPLVCVVPSPGSPGVDIVAVAGGRIVTRDLVEATGQHRDVTREGCTGWESADFSSDGSRVFMSAEYTCPGNIKRATSEVMAITPEGEWLDVRGATVKGLPAGVRALRYQAAKPGTSVPSDLAWAVQGEGAMASSTAREAAGQPLVAGDVVEAAHHLDAAVVEAWLVEEGQGFDVSGAQLVQLKRDGVPGRVTDVMVALSYPGVFAFNVSNHQATRREPQPTVGGYYGHPPVYGMGYASPWGCYSPFSWDCYSPYGWGYYSPYAYSPFGYYSPYGYWAGYGFYPSGGVIVVPGGGGQVARHGRMVIGRGYTGGTASGTSGHPRAQEPPPSSGGYRSAGSGGHAPPPSSPPPSGSSSSGSSSSGSGRTAHPKP